MSFTNNYDLLKDRFHVFRSVSYDKMMNLIYKFKTGILYIGGAWCKNCQAIISVLNKTAKKCKIRTVYHYDPHFVNVFKEEVDLRDCKDLETKLNYYYLIEKIGYTSEELVQDTLIPRLPVPAIIGIKNGICVGIITDEYEIVDDHLVKENDTKDYTEEYTKKLEELFLKVKAKNK